MKKWVNNRSTSNRNCKPDTTAIIGVVLTVYYESQQNSVNEKPFFFNNVAAARSKIKSLWVNFRI